jgi:hypothetical protein
MSAGFLRWILFSLVSGIPSSLPTAGGPRIGGVSLPAQVSDQSTEPKTGQGHGDPAPNAGKSGQRKVSKADQLATERWNRAPAKAHCQRHQAQRICPDPTNVTPMIARERKMPPAQKHKNKT